MSKSLLKKVLIMVLMCALCITSFTACGEDADNDPAGGVLSVPGNVRVENKMLVWDAVENADSYMVYVDTTRNIVKTCSFDLSDLKEKKTYKIRVRALADKNYEPSDWFTMSYTPGAPSGQGGASDSGDTFEEQPFVSPYTDADATAGLEYTLLDDGSGYEVSKGTADLTGVVVIPQYHNDLPVVAIANYGFTNETQLQAGTEPAADVGEDEKYNTVTTEIALTDKIKSIGSKAFAYCTKIENFVMPNSVERFGGSVFLGCIGLKAIKLSRKISHISTSTFKDCTSLEEITIPSSVTSLLTSSQAFSGCSSLKTINLPNTLTSIGSNVFSGCTALESLILPEGITEIKSRAFRDCTSLTTVSIPSTLKTLDGNPFVNCPSINRITFPKGNAYYKTINGALVDKEGGLVMLFAGDDIPAGVTSLGEYSLERLSEKDTLVIPLAVKKMYNSSVVGVKNVVLHNNLYYLAPQPFGSETNIFFKGAGYEDWRALIIKSIRYKLAEDGDERAYTYTDDEIIRRNAWSLTPGYGYDSQLYYYSETEPEETRYNYWHYDENGDVIIWDKPSSDQT